MAKATKSWKKFPKQLAPRYFSEIRPVTDRLSKLYKEIIEPELEELLNEEIVQVPEDQRSMDASISEKIAALFKVFREKYFKQTYNKNQDPKTVKFRKTTENRVQEAGKQIARFHKARFGANALSIGGETLRGEPWLKGYLRDWTMQNVSLIKDIPVQSIDRMQQQVTTSVLRGDSRTFLKDQIQKLLNTSETRAKLIARDQSNKMYGTLTELRANNNGWDFYEWDTSGDERVRPDHKRLNGKIYKFSEPPVTVRSGKRSGERNNPGEDIQCFPAGTRVKVKGGDKNIEDIKIGDEVYCHGGIEKVVELHKNHYEGELIGVKFLHETVWLTPSHKLFVEGKGWRRADVLKKGDKPVEFEKLFSGDFLNKKAVRDIEHPHPHLLSQKLVSDWVNSWHRLLAFDDRIKAIKLKICDIIDSINLIRFFKFPLRSVINTKDVKPSCAKDLRLRDDPVLPISMLFSLFGWNPHFAPFRVINPLGCYSFASTSNGNFKMVESFLDNPAPNSDFLGNHPIRPEIADVFFSEPLAKVNPEFLLDGRNVTNEKTFTGTFFRTKEGARIFKLGFNCLKSFVTNLAVNINILIWSAHKKLHRLINKSTTRHQYEVVGLESQYHNGDIYNFGVDESMSYFANDILVANCRCIAIVIFDQQMINNLRKQPDGSYKTAKAA